MFQAHGISSTTNYNNKVNMTWSSNDSSVSEEELFKLSTYEVEEIFKEVFIRYFKADDQGEFSEKLKLDGSETSFVEQRHRSFGRCYTLHPDRRHLGIYYMRFKL